MMKNYFKWLMQIIKEIDRKPIGKILNAIENVAVNKGRLFIIGVGGSSANATHAACDFRKLCGLEVHTPCDNIAELTARINDDGWDDSFVYWLSDFKPTEKDMLLVFSVGGGNEKKKVSNNIVRCLKYAKERKMFIGGIVGRDGGYTKKVADWCVVIPTMTPYLITPFAEAFQGIIWHFWAFHPNLQINTGKWEGIELRK